MGGQTYGSDYEFNKDLSDTSESVADWLNFARTRLTPTFAPASPVGERRPPRVE